MNYKIARGYLSKNEREYLYKIASKAATIINVGIEYGSSIHCFVAGSSPQTKILAIDLIGTEKFEGYLDCATDELNEYNIVTHLAQGDNLINIVLEAYEQKVVLFIAGNSNTIPLAQTAEVIFIDGCHWGTCFQNDITKYSQLCTQYLLFHDYSDSPIHAGVKEALDNWQTNEFEFIEQVDTIRAYKRITDA